MMRTSHTTRQAASRARRGSSSHRHGLLHTLGARRLAAREARRAERAALSAPRLVRLVVRLGLLAVVVFGLWGASTISHRQGQAIEQMAADSISLNTDPSVSGAQPAPATDAAAPGDVALGGDTVSAVVAGSGDLDAFSGVPAGVSAVDGSRGNFCIYVAEPGQKGQTECKYLRGGVNELLPWERWESLSSLGNRQTGFTGIFKTIFSALADLLFTIANLIWRIILGLIQLATTNTWLTSSAYTVNALFVRLAIPAYVMVALGWFIVLARGGKLALKGDIVGILRSVFIFLLPVGFLFASLQGASAIVDTGNRYMAANGCDVTAADSNCDAADYVEAGRVAMASASSNPVIMLSPVYLAAQVQGIFDEISTVFSDTMLLAGGGRIATENNVLGSQATPTDPNCGQYIGALLARYRAAATGIDASRTQTLGDAAQEEPQAIFTHAAIAWVSGLYEPWSQAQFGDTNLRATAACHMLEESNGISVNDRMINMATAYESLSQSVGRQTLNGNVLVTAGHESVYHTVPGKAVIEAPDESTCNKSSGWDINPIGLALNVVNNVAGTCIPTGPVGFITGTAQNATNAAVGAVADPINAAAASFNGSSLKFSGDESNSVNESKEILLRSINWAACHWTGSKWVADPAWIGVGKTSIGVQDGMTDEEIQSHARLSLSEVTRESQYCTTRWVYGHGPDQPLMNVDKGEANKFVSGDGANADGKKGINGQLGEIDADTTNGDTQLHGVDSSGARRALKNYIGDEPGNRLIYAMAAVIGAVSYFFLIGGPSIGLLLATFGLIVLLALLPLLLAIVAAGFEGGQKAIRMLIGLLGSKAMFALLILLVVELQLLTVSLLKVIGDAGIGSVTPVARSGFISTLLVMISPLIVIWMLNKLLSTLGIGKINSLRGSMGLMSDLASKASRSDSMGAFMNQNPPGRIRKAWDGKLGETVKGYGKALLPKALQNRDLKREGRHLNTEARDLEKKIAAETNPDKKKELEERLAGVKKGSGKVAAQLAAREREISRKRKNMAIGAAAMAVTAGVGSAAVFGLAGAAALAGAGTIGAAAWELRRKVKANIANEVDEVRNGVEPELDWAKEGNHTDTGEVVAVDGQSVVGRKASAQRILEARTRGRAPEEVEAIAADVARDQLIDLTADANGGTTLTDGKMNGVQLEYAQRQKMDANDVLVSHYGMALPNPEMLSANPQDIPKDLRSNPVFFLDQDVRMRRDGETNADYATRLSGELVGRGLVWNDGDGVQFADAFALAKVDASVGTFMDYAAGKPDVLSQFSGTLMTTGLSPSMSMGISSASQVDYNGIVRDLVQKRLDELVGDSARVVQQLEVRPQVLVGEIDQALSNITLTSAGTITVDSEAALRTLASDIETELADLAKGYSTVHVGMAMGVAQNGVVDAHEAGVAIAAQVESIRAQVQQAVTASRGDSVEMVRALRSQLESLESQVAGLPLDMIHNAIDSLRDVDVPTLNGGVVIDRPALPFPTQRAVGSSSKSWTPLPPGGGGSGGRRGG